MGMVGVILKKKTSAYLIRHRNSHIPLNSQLKPKLKANEENKHTHGARKRPRTHTQTFCGDAKRCAKMCRI